MSVTKDKRNYKSYDELDWVSIRWDYENTKISMKKLGDKYQTYSMNISREAKAHAWVKYDPVKLALDKYEKKPAVVNPNGMLDTIAVRKIQEIVKELGTNYSSVDEPLVVMYAKNYQRYLRLELIVDEEGEVCVSPKTGATYMNPHFAALQSVMSNMSKLGDKLGLSIASRSRIGMSLGEEDNTKSLFDFVDDMSQEKDIDV